MVEDMFMLYMVEGRVLSNVNLDASHVYIVGKKMYPFYIRGFGSDIHKYQALIDSWIGVEIG